MGKKWIIAIGASGSAGLEDICALLSHLSPKTNAIILIVLHRPWDKPSKLWEILSRCSTIPVVIPAQGDFLRPGVAYIGEPSIHLTLLESSFAILTKDRAQQYKNRTIDLLFKSVADYGGNHTIGVILSGSLDDGSRGLAAIHHSGGYTMVLKPSSCSEYSMPENAISYDGPITTVGDGVMLAMAIDKLISANIKTIV